MLRHVADAWRLTAKAEYLLRCLPLVAQHQQRFKSASVNDIRHIPFVNQSADKLASRLTDDSDVCDFNYRTFEVQLFEALRDGQDSVPLSRLLREIKNSGLRRTDPRLAESMQKIDSLMTHIPQTGDVDLRLTDLKDVIKDNIVLMRKALFGDFVIQEFPEFCAAIDETYWVCRCNAGGEVSAYLPLLSRQSKDLWGVALCTIDGQRHAIGDVDVPFTIHAGGRPINYALAVNELGQDVVHQYVGQEPSDETVMGHVRLDGSGKPQNPLINAGALVIASLLHPSQTLDERFEAVIAQYRKLCGGGPVSFSNSVFLAEREVADHNYAAGYFLRHHKCFPAGVDLHETLDLYLQLCSVEVTADSGAVIAATLANSGFCPITGEQVLNHVSVRNTLSLMHSCGMYNYSGGFAFRIGLPGKAGISGVILLVIPNVMGLCLWSPAIDAMGISVRGLQFSEQLVQKFDFQHYKSGRHSMENPTATSQPHSLRSSMTYGRHTVKLLFTAANNDITGLRGMALNGYDMSAKNYDGRTALHLAACEGHLDCIRFLLEKCSVDPSPRDRWGQTPLDEARNFRHLPVVQYLEQRLNIEPHENQCNSTAVSSSNENDKDNRILQNTSDCTVKD